MDIQAEIKWIQSELMNVKDPELIQAFKSLLEYRLKKGTNVNEVIKNLLISRALKSESDINEGKLLSRKEMDAKSKSAS